MYNKLVRRQERQSNCSFLRYNTFMKHTDLRNNFSKFWEDKNHKEIPPIPLVLENDPTTLFNGSGMQQLVPYLLGQEHPLGTRLYNIQRSFRTQDIEEVGDNRHTTFFEMMGNWSLGDYFKEEQLAWFWEFLTKELGLPKEKLYVTVFEGNKEVPKDEESISIWKKLGIKSDHIHAYPAEKNWWSRAGIPENMPEGEAGGPDSEVFYEFTQVQHDPKFGKECHPNCDCGRFLEIGNSVFIQYKKNGMGQLEELPKKNVDFGGGLERILAAMTNDPDVFKIDVLWPIIEKIKSLSGKEYDKNNQSSMRVIADHMRASVMLIADGVTPSNKDQGYVLRRLIRRSIRHGRDLNLTQGFTAQLAQSAMSIFKTAYPQVNKHEQKIVQELTNEEQKFQLTLSRGLKEFERMIKTHKKLTAGDAFFLYESYGFPVEVTKELADEKNISIDLKGFNEEKMKHQTASRQGSQGKFKGGLADQSEQTVKLHTATHLLHQSLRTILGIHVQQKGSNITAERLRFDFSYPDKMTDVQIKQVEDMVNEQISKNLSVSKRVTTYDEAIKEGALAFFGERYPEKVSVYSVGSFSKEICGGPHVTNTKELGHFRITKESSAGAGIRRIYAILE
ncbi:MAG: Alanine-tRNA ligase [Candidatus Roizmanbacteria bacterium GW2011_GWC2_41_7]|uniref:alanine--tRNA ligase n=3 Tax=Candidatus Roizmaniibacteriota TaxID=1752723 RepID=A0A0G0X8L0_9BACT|nr:MAG: Alanine-tRNA ligase [Candidatus Roizmanbacteria bacterium GW2011_GWC2_41_7]